MIPQSELAELIRLKSLSREQIGGSEDNITQKFLPPLLKALGHQHEDIDFQKTLESGRVEAYLHKGLPKDSRVIFEVKRLGSDLNDPAVIGQIKRYFFGESPLFVVVTNGEELRVYGQLRGVEFERSLLFKFERASLDNENEWTRLKSLLSRDALAKREAHQLIERREAQIRQVSDEEEELKENSRREEEGLRAEIESTKSKLRELEDRLLHSNSELQARIGQLWEGLGLPAFTENVDDEPTTRIINEGGLDTPSRKKARKVTFRELTDGGLIRDGAELFFYHAGRTFRDERVVVVAENNAVRYNNREYSVSELAATLLKKHGFKSDDHGVAGPIYWKTGDGVLLRELHERVRMVRGDRD